MTSANRSASRLRLRFEDVADDVVVAAAAFDEEYHGMAVGLRHHASSAAVIGIGFLTQEIVVRRFYIPVGLG